MGTLTRRDRVALGAVQGGALYYGPTRRWPEPAIGVFEPYATHPGPTSPPARPPSDIDGHSIKGFLVSDLDGTPKLYSGYGSALRNVAPVHIWPMNLDGTFGPAPAHTMNTFGMTNYLAAEGKLWCLGDQGAKAFCTGSPGGTWVDGTCPPYPGDGSDGGMTHGHHLVRHAGYTWISGQRRVTGNTGAVWRCTDPTGADGQFVWGDGAGLEVYHPTGMFSYQGKLWMQPAADFPGIPPPDYAPPLPAYANHKLCYWDEAAHTFLPTTLEFVYAGRVAVPWKTVMLVAGASQVHSFNGTSITTVYSPPGGVAGPAIGDICVTPDDTVWIMDGHGVGRSSTDLVTWTKRFETDFVSTQTFTVYGDYAYVGDEHDHIFRTKVTG